MRKEELLSEVVKCAELYDKKLKDKSLMFVFQKRADNKLSCIESCFKAHNYLHLTGVSYNGKSAVQFYKECINHKLRLVDIDFKTDGTTEQKVKVLRNVVMIERTSRMIGDYLGAGKISLYTEKLAGNTTGCLGFVRKKGQVEYIPNTALNQDIRDITHSPQDPVKAIFKKYIRDDKYNQICYTAKKFDVSVLLNSSQISCRLNNDLSEEIKKTALLKNDNSQLDSSILPNQLPDMGSQGFGGQGFGGLS